MEQTTLKCFMVQKMKTKLLKLTIRTSSCIPYIMFTNTCALARCMLNHCRPGTVTNIVRRASNFYSFETKKFMLAVKSQLAHFEKTTPFFPKCYFKN